MYWAFIENGFIVSIGKGQGSQEIAESEFNAIKNAVKSRPETREGYGVRLRANDLVWEEFEVPIDPPDPDPDLDDSEALEILLGGAE